MTARDRLLALQRTAAQLRDDIDEYLISERLPPGMEFKESFYTVNALDSFIAEVDRIQEATYEVPGD